ncbi:acylphosphatase [Virgibacillus kimchii]
MTNYKNNTWLSHLDESLPDSAFGYKLCIYTIALEGWRRGLNLKFFNVYRNDRGTLKLTVRFSLSNNEKEHRFAVSRGDLVSKKAINICVDKDLTKKYLLKSNVPTPKGESFDGSQSNNEVMNYFKTLDYPVVLKPSDAGGGKGVITNIKTTAQLQKALEYVRGDLNYKDVILERYIVGEDHRIYVVDDEVVGVYKRIAANVIGDGESTIGKLIDKKNKERKKNPYLYGRLIKKDKEMNTYLASKNLTLDSIPKENERIFIREKGSLSAGGEPIDVTDEISSNVKETAINAVKAIPGLIHGAVDMIIDNDSNVGIVNEVNSKPQISNHLYPVEGYARDIPKAIIDYYFPETKNKVKNTSLYFDFDSILPPLANGNVKEIRVPSIPYKKTTLKKFVISGKVQKVGYRIWLRKQAHGLKLNGFVENKKNGDVKVVVAGNDESLKQFKSIIETEACKKARVTKVVEKEWNKPIKVGFEIRDNKKHNENKLNKIEQELKEKERELEKINRQYKSIIQSRTWLLTSPLRKIGMKIKNRK